MVEIPGWLSRELALQSVKVELEAGVPEDDGASLLRGAHAGWACFASRVVRLPVAPDPGWGVLLEAELIDGAGSVRLRRVDGRLESVRVREGRGEEVCLRDEVDLLARDGFDLPGSHLRHHRYWRRRDTPGGCAEWRPAFSFFVGFSGGT